jgi:serine/threonine protein kinase
MMLEFAFGEPPYLNLPQTQVCYMILTMTPPEIEPHRWSKQMRDFVKVCLTKDPKERPSAGELMTHPFMRTANLALGREQLVWLIKCFQES